MEQENYKKQIEAVLFTVGRSLDIQQIADLIGLGSVGVVKDALTQLKEEYTEKNSALEIIEDNNKFRMNIKSEHMHLVKDLMPSMELTKPTIETQAIIAWKQPILQSTVVKIRGTPAYDHVKLLLEQEFLTADPKGLSKILKLTPKFFQYFDTNKDILKNTLNKIEEPEIDQPGPASVPSEEMPKMPSPDISPGEIGLKEKKNKNNL